jgi:hypothetical protein
MKVFKKNSYQYEDGMKLKKEDPIPISCWYDFFLNKKLETSTNGYVQKSRPALMGNQTLNIKSINNFPG